ncbi:reverse transcriptase domain-containing protein [Enterococcus avium]|uniref:reverse transcriptase domain-containing protein n=1 Tax=Enterococcus avium TaxID=33945 RepID=UPI0021B1119B|nr:reverse transcriptase domain-containing protein [Enterococcus avium]
MRDRLIQQMFKQILEPICEAKFYKHSYGFRPNRSTEHAIARCATLANAGQCHYVVDIDIKGFFDNVNHNKLLKQLYTIGVKDKRVLTIISKMLKTSERGFPASTKGTTQGSILSPLLSNVVLNDLDWWITTQWEDFPTRHPYSTPGIRSRYLRKIQS